MTAQVAVMNTLGIALATDSAVSVGFSARKIYTSSDKLFRLSKNAPVAIMINGNADFLGVPWEAVIKIYKNNLDQKTFGRLSEYADDFFDFIQFSTSIFPYGLRDEYVKPLIKNLLSEALEEIEDELDEETKRSNGAINEGTSSIIHKIVMERIDEEKEHQKINGFSIKDAGPTFIRDFQTRYGQIMKAVRKDTFEEYTLPAKTKRALDVLVVEMIKGKNFGAQMTEIVFAGFGDAEYMPTLRSYEVQGMIRKQLRHYLANEIKVAQENTAAIMPFGQTDIVSNFLDGIHPKLKFYMKESIEDLVIEVTEVYDQIPDLKLTKRKEKRIASDILKKMEELFDGWDEQEEDSWMPIVNVVESLPKDELAAMSEMLVNLTKFRLRISSEWETVGGPINVAVITKGDGFVWVKRKNYFSAELNPHKSAN